MLGSGGGEMGDRGPLPMLLYLFLNLPTAPFFRASASASGHMGRTWMGIFWGRGGSGCSWGVCNFTYQVPKVKYLGYGWQNQSNVLTRVLVGYRDEGKKARAPAESALVLFFTVFLLSVR